MADLTTRQRLIASQLDKVTPEQLQAYTRNEAGMDPELLDALLQASTEAPFGRISDKTLALIGRITGEKPSYLSDVADLINAVPPHERDGMLASLAVGQHDSRYVRKLTQSYANLSASDLIEQKRAAAAKADRWSNAKPEPVRQDIVDYRKQNESRREAIERAAGINRDPANLARAALNPALGPTLGAIMDNSRELLDNPEGQSRRDIVSHAMDLHMASDMGADLLGISNEDPERQDD